MQTTNLPGLGQPNEDKGPHIIGVVTTVTVVALATVCMRIYVRLRIVNMFGADDWTIIVAMILSLAGLGVAAGEVAYGAGRHIAYLDPDTNRFGLKLNFVSQPIYLWAIPLVKMSVGFFLLRIAPTKTYRRILQCTMIFLMAYTLMCTLTLFLQCENLAVLWDARVETVCWSTTTTLGLSYANSTVNILTDIFFALIPVPMLWNVQINARTKASLICILGLGVFASAAAIVKAAYLSNYGKTGDFLWDSANLTIWIATEANTGIIAACLPCLKPMFKRILDSSARYMSSSNKKDGYKLHAYGPGIGFGSKYNRSIVTTQIGTHNTKTSSDSTNKIRESILSEIDMPANSITKTTMVVIHRSELDTQIDRSTWLRRGDIQPEQKVEDMI